MFVTARRNRSDSASRAYAKPPSCVSTRASVVRTGAVTFVISGRRFEPVNFVIVFLACSCVCKEGGLRTKRQRTLSSRAEARYHPVDGQKEPLSAHQAVSTFRQNVEDCIGMVRASFENQVTRGLESLNR